MKSKEFNLDSVLAIVNDINTRYDLPEITITDGEWKALLDNLAKCFKDRDNDDLEVSINIIIRRAFHDALFDSCAKISFYYVIEALNDLTAFSVNESKRNELKNSIMYDALKNNVETKELKKTK